MGELGTHTVRVANTSECTNNEESETACGFVIEFVDIITTYNMNTTNTNAGGWQDSQMRTYVNETIYNTLPSDLQSKIITTKVISGNGLDDGDTNFETNDKLYLLSAQEIWSYISGDNSMGTSKQLDYYKKYNLSYEKYGEAAKKYNGTEYNWWLRSARSYSNGHFIIVRTDGSWKHELSTVELGVSPAFRIG